MTTSSDRVVRMPLRSRGRTRRGLDERLSLRFPGAFAPVFRLLGHLPPNSRLRQRVMNRGVALALDAYNRRDLEAVTIGYHRDLEYIPYREFVEAALVEPLYRGPAGYRAYIESTYDVWGEDGVHLEPTELIDLGDRLVLLADMPMQAQASGISLSQKYAAVMTLDGGKVRRHQDFLDQAEALRSVGLAS